MVLQGQPRHPVMFEQTVLLARVAVLSHEQMQWKNPILKGALDRFAFKAGTHNKLTGSLCQPPKTLHSTDGVPLTTLRNHSVGLI